MGRSRTSERISSWFGNLPFRIFEVPCYGEIHKVRISRKGRVTLLDHPDGHLPSIGKEAMMLPLLTGSNGCMGVAMAFTTGMIVRFSKQSTDLVAAIQISQVLHSTKLKKMGREDPLIRPRTKRDSPFVEEAVANALASMTFRSTPRVGHEVIVVQRFPDVRVTVSKRIATADERKPGKRDHRRDKWKQVIRAFINDKKWARIYLYGIAVVENRFITQIVKFRSRRDMRVRYIRQSKGYSIAQGEGNIRLGSDGVWRFV